MYRCAGSTFSKKMFNAYLNFLGKVTRSNKELADLEREARLEKNEVVFSVEAFGIFDFLLDLVRGLSLLRIFQTSSSRGPPRREK